MGPFVFSLAPIEEWGGIGAYLLDCLRFGLSILSDRGFCDVILNMSKKGSAPRETVALGSFQKTCACFSLSANEQMDRSYSRSRRSPAGGDLGLRFESLALLTVDLM